MFIVVFKPGPRAEGAFSASITSEGHAPLLFLWFDPDTERSTWVEKFENCHIFRDSNDALLAMATQEKLEAIMNAAFEKMTLALQDLPTPVPTEGSVAVMPLQLGAPVFAGHASP